MDARTTRQRGECDSRCPACGAGMTPVECQIIGPRYVSRVGAPVPPARTAAWWLCGSCGHATPREAAASR
jgi:hypothetical protein